MNIYQVDIDDGSWTVLASTLLSAIRQAANADNFDRNENNYMNLDHEVREHSIKIEVSLLTRNATQEQIDEIWDEESEQEMNENL